MSEAPGCFEVFLLMGFSVLWLVFWSSKLRWGSFAHVIFR